MPFEFSYTIADVIVWLGHIDGLLETVSIKSLKLENFGQHHKLCSSRINFVAFFALFVIQIIRYRKIPNDGKNCML